MVIFTELKKLREFQRTHLPHLRSIEDFDIVQEIGACRERGERMTPKNLLLAGIAPPATIQRRVSRLVGLGVIRKSYSSADGRVIELSVSPDTSAVYSRMRQLLHRLRKRPAPAAASPKMRPRSPKKSERVHRIGTSNHFDD